MEVFRYCRACLVTDVKMYTLDTMTETISLGEIYSIMLQTFLPNGYFCFECARLLQKWQQFKSRCHRANEILCTVQANNQQLTQNVVKNIDRIKNKLGLRLIISPLNETYFDLIDNAEETIVSDRKPDTELKMEETSVKIEMQGLNNLENIVIDNLNDCENSNEPIDNDNCNYLPEDTHSCKQDTKRSECSTSRRKRKAHRTKKQKINKFDVSSPNVELKNNANCIENTLSDDEPLAKLSKINGDKENVKKKYPKNFNIDHFEDYATVVFLTPEDAKKELQMRRDTLNYKNSPYKCELCYRGYEAKAAFENHKKRHSADYGQYKCDLCHLRFPEQRFLCKHRLACHKRKFYCKLCPYVCFCTHQAKTHVSLHKGKKYPCKECSEVFSMPNSLLMHKRLKHVTECVCELCGNTFATPRGLYSHNMKIHRQDRNSKLGPKCDDCGIHFATEVAWKRHLVLSSKHQVSNGCKDCGETFPNSDELKRHVRVHARKHVNRNDNVKLPAKCDICEKWLSDRNEYKSHMMNEHPQSDVAKKLDLGDQTPFVCEVCGQMFKKQCFLTYHQRKHTGERPYKCTECGKCFQLSGALSTHRAVHTRKRVHKCDMCARVFTFKSALNKHMKVHLGIRPHKCTICDKSFINKCDVKLHVKYVHNKVPWPKRDRNKRNATDDRPFVTYN